MPKPVPTPSLADTTTKRQPDLPRRTKKEVKADLEPSGVVYMLKQCYPTIQSRRN